MNPAAPTPTIDEFIRARLTEDETIARAAGEGPRAHWAFAGEDDPDTNGEVYRPDTVHTVPLSGGTSSREFEYVTMDREGTMSSVDPDEARHIARHDPARSADETALYRGMLARHRPRFPYDDESVCTTCHDYDAHDGAPWPCEDIRGLAAIWAPHPDYRAEWAPSSEERNP